MTMACITQILNNASSLQAASCTNRQDTLHIMPAAFTLRPEAALTPQYTLTHNTLSQIVSRLYPGILNKRPQMLPQIQDTTTSTRQGLTAVGATAQQFFCPLHQRLHASLKRLPGECSITYPFAQIQNVFGQMKQFISDSSHCPIAFAQCLKISFQVGPAQLTQAAKTIVNPHYVGVT